MRVTVEIRRPRWMTSRRLKLARPVVLVMALAIAAPVLATDTFADVPAASPHHNDINTIAVAGITRGCNPPTNNLYCPADPVRRDQMASFLQRGLGRGSLGHVTDTEFDLHTTPTTLGSTTLTVPGSGFVQVNAAVNSTQVVLGGLCVSGAHSLHVRVSDPTSGAASNWMDESIAASGSGSASATYLFDVDVTGPTARTFNVDAFMSLAACYDVDFDLTAVWVPFGSTGGSTLGTEASTQPQPGSSRP